jgi:hypothetical protein
MFTYKAFAHTGLAWLNELGTFDTEGEALDALEEEYDRQLPSLIEAYGSEDVFEIFWVDCRIDKEEVK